MLITARAHGVTCTPGLSDAETSASSRASDSSVEKVRPSKTRSEYVLTALTLTAYIESIHRDS